MFSEDETNLPPFGYSTWPWVPATKDGDSARAFYNAWTNFSSNKDFVWKDQWNINEAPDRRVRRLMEKDNKKARDDARKEYNDTIRSLAKFIRKRDPRYKAFLAQQATAAANRTASGTPTGTSTPKKPPSGVYVEQEWQKLDIRGLDVDLEWAAAEGDDPEEWECVACGKTFRSEAAWDSHERSKKHMKEIERLRREMQNEDEELGLDVGDPPPVSPSSSPEPEPNIITDPLDSVVANEAGGKPRKKKQKKPENGADVEPLTKTERLAQKHEDYESDDTATDQPEGSGAGLTKREKRRARQAKKTQNAEPAKIQCNVCKETFENRTKLFAHINAEGHALAEEISSSRKKGSGRARGGA